MFAKQSTALTLIVGPILDLEGAEYASAVIGDLSISKNGGTLTALAAAATLTYIANGQYTLVLTTGNTDTIGVIQITCNKATYQMPTAERHVIPANVYNSLIAGSDYLDVETAAMAANTLTAAALATDAVTEIQSGLSTVTTAQINAEVLDVLTTDTFAELAAVPAATSSLKDKLTYLFMTARNKVTQTSTTRLLKADDGTTTVATETVSDDGTTFTKGEAS